MKKEIINDDFSMVPAKSYWSDVGRRFLKNRIALLGALILGIIVFMCAAAPLFTQYDPVKDMVLGVIIRHLEENFCLVQILWEEIFFPDFFMGEEPLF